MMTTTQTTALPHPAYAAEASLLRTYLIGVAQAESLRTYTEAEHGTGLHRRVRMSHVLDNVAATCKALGEPDLASLVIRADTGRPGSGWKRGRRTWEREVAACHAYARAGRYRAM
jgi:hypothetical protein